MSDHLLLKHRIPNRLPPPQRTLELEDKETLISLRDPRKPLHARDIAIMELLWVCDPRKAEIPEILLKNIDLEYRWIRFLQKATNRKGERWRQARLSPDAVRAMRRWLKTRKRIAAPDCKTLFCSQSGNQMTPDGVACIFKRLTKKAGFVVSPHDFRRGGACYMVECEVPDRIVMEQFGWKDYTTFHRYTRRVKLNALDGLLWEERDD